MVSSDKCYSGVVGGAMQTNSAHDCAAICGTIGSMPSHTTASYYEPNLEPKWLRAQRMQNRHVKP